MRLIGKIRLIVLLLLVIGGAFLLAAIVLPTPQPEISAAIAARQQDAARGAYIATLGDCVACHTTPHGKKLAGGLAFPTPVGTVYSSNITPDPDTGIGKYSFKDFVRVMRFGVALDGTHLYPAMPYTAYAKVSDEDLQDLFAYLQQQVAPVHEAVRTDGTKWPLGMRWPLAVWDYAFLDTGRFIPDASKGDDWNRGAYLVQGLAHCGTCHTPRGVGYQEKDVDGHSNLYLAGSVLDGGSPINLRGNAGDGLARWNAEDIAEILETGRNAHSAVTGSMTEVVADSTQYLTHDDVAAIAAYLKSLSPAPEEGRATFTASDETLHTIMSGAEQPPGGRIFMDSCAACHRLSGAGATQVFPGLTGNPSVLSQDPSSLIAVILNGTRLPSTAAAPSELAMPGFAWRYNDRDIAALATFIRSSWGNHASSVSASQVAALRAR